MGRKNKNSADFFPHYVTHGDKMSYLESVYKNDGYAVWFKLMEKLGRSDFHYIDLSKKFELKFLSTRLNVEENTLKEIIEILCEWEWLDAKLWRENNVLFSQEFVDSLEELYKRRCSHKPTINDIYVHINKIDVDINNNDVDKSTQSKVKESKGKKSIIKNKVLDFIKLTTSEHEKLIEKLGEERTFDYLERLNNYIGSKGKKYKSHYHTILTWHRRENPPQKKIARPELKRL